MRFVTKLLCRIALSAPVLFSVLVSAADAETTPTRPNIVFIYADDWRWDCLGVVQREQGERARFPWLQTPRLDQFARRSVRFEQSFVVNSLCSPGRACVLTGQYNHLNGIVGNRQPLPVDTTTVATRLQEAGYTTAYFGKWHMDGQRERPGFDFVASFVGQGRYFDCPILLNGTQTPTAGWIDDVSTDFAIEFLKEHSSAAPFFLFLGFKSPHGPRGGDNLPQRVRDLYVGEKSRPVANLDEQPIYRKANAAATSRPRTAQRQAERQFEAHRAYMRHITAIDECVGRLLDALDETGQAENTLVIVTSDNGYYLGEHGLGDKRTAYEESIRVPLMIRLPGDVTPPAAVDDAMALNIDYAPTILDFAGADPLPDAQGRSLRPLLVGQSPPDWRTAFFYEYFKEARYAAPTTLAVRTATHKLITYPGHDDWTELFELQSDPYETKNLADDADLLEKLRRVFDAEARAVAFRMPEIVGQDTAPPGRRQRMKAKAESSARQKALPTIP